MYYTIQCFYQPAIANPTHLLQAYKIYYSRNADLHVWLWETMTVDDGLVETNLTNLAPLSLYTVLVEPYTKVGPGPLSKRAQVREKTLEKNKRKTLQISRNRFSKFLNCRLNVSFLDWLHQVISDIDTILTWWDQAVCTRTYLQSYTLPSKPTNLYAAETGHTTATVSWDLPQEDITALELFWVDASDDDVGARKIFAFVTLNSPLNPSILCLVEHPQTNIVGKDKCVRANQTRSKSDLQSLVGGTVGSSG